MEKHPPVTRLSPGQPVPLTPHRKTVQQLNLDPNRPQSWPRARLRATSDYLDAARLCAQAFALGETISVLDLDSFAHLLFEQGVKGGYEFVTGTDTRSPAHRFMRTSRDDLLRGINTAASQPQFPHESGQPCFKLAVIRPGAEYERRSILQAYQDEASECMDKLLMQLGTSAGHKQRLLQALDADYEALHAHSQRQLSAMHRRSVSQERILTMQLRELLQQDQQDIKDLELLLAEVEQARQLPPASA